MKMLPLQLPTEVELLEAECPAPYKMGHNSKDPASHTGLRWVPLFPNYEHDLGDQILFLLKYSAFRKTQKEKFVFIKNNNILLTQGGASQLEPMPVFINKIS